MRNKDWITYTACFWWTTGTSPLVIPYMTIDGVLRKFREEGGSSYTLEDNVLTGTHSPDGKSWSLTISSHYVSTDEGRYEEDQ
tara:strand:- start:7320 stop:7568 length:249 start_codon:yes stop_codon:yes gene_type:complete